MIASGTTMDSVTLGNLGLTIEFTAYDDGSIDWYAVSDSASWSAQSWGVDENGLYLYNGSRNPCALENGSLVLSLNGDRNQQVFFTCVESLELKHRKKQDPVPRRRRLRRFRFFYRNGNVFLQLSSALPAYGATSACLPALSKLVKTISSADLYKPKHSVIIPLSFPLKRRTFRRFF